MGGKYKRAHLSRILPLNIKRQWRKKWLIFPFVLFLDFLGPTFVMRLFYLGGQLRRHRRRVAAGRRVGREVAAHLTWNKTDSNRGDKLENISLRNFPRGSCDAGCFRFLLQSV